MQRSHPKKISVQVICHGIPDRRPLEEGDIVNVDVSVFYKGFHADLNETFVVGEKTDAASEKLVKTTHEVCKTSKSFKISPGHSLLP